MDEEDKRREHGGVEQIKRKPNFREPCIAMGAQVFRLRLRSFAHSFTTIFQAFPPPFLA